jgi:hypothetical protein
MSTAQALDNFLLENDIQAIGFVNLYFYTTYIRGLDWTYFLLVFGFLSKSTARKKQIALQIMGM